MDLRVGKIMAKVCTSRHARCDKRGGKERPTIVGIPRILISFNILCYHARASG